MDERDILDLVRRAAKIEPDASATRHAMHGARAAIDASESIQRRKRRKRWIIMTTSGVAAAIVAGLALFFMSTSSQTVSAAERLAEAAKASESYRGWVHVTAEAIDHAKKTRQSVAHFNTEDGTYISDLTNSDGKRAVRLWRPSTREETTYDTYTSQVRIGTLSTNFAEKWKESTRNSPLTLNGMIEGDNAREIKVILQKREGDLDRFDLTCPTGPDASAHPAKASVWVDPKTSLFQKAEVESNDESVSMRFVYGDPVIKDIYDVNVPRNAQVIDNRLKQDVEGVFSRLDKRVAAGFGPYVAVESTYELDADGRPQALGSILLMSENGKGDVLSSQYVVGKAPEVPNRIKRADLPEGWPMPTVEAASRALKDAVPTEFVVIRGHRSGWRGSISGPGEMRTTVLEGVNVQLIPGLLAGQTLCGQIWPTRERLGLFGVGATAWIEPIENHPEWIGLKVQQTTWSGEGERDDPDKMSRTETLFVLDPARDDMPVRLTFRSFEPKESEPDWEFTLEYLEHAQLAGGQWYPTLWTTTTTSRDNAGKAEQTSEIIRLQIFPGQSLGDEWFVNYGDLKK